MLILKLRQNLQFDYEKHTEKILSLSAKKFLAIWIKSFSVIKI